MALRKLDEIKEAAKHLPKEEKLELARYLTESAQKDRYPDKVVDLSRFYGIAHFEEDAMDLQKRWRAEWD